MQENIITGVVIDKAIQVHKFLGPGLLESTYEKCLSYELKREGFQVELQKSLPVYYKGEYINCGYRIDMFVEEKVIVEIKSVRILHDVHTAQLLTYLKLSECKVGLLINFNNILLKTGLKRIVNNF